MDSAKKKKNRDLFMVTLMKMGILEALFVIAKLC